VSAKPALCCGSVAVHASLPHGDRLADATVLRAECAIHDPALDSFPHYVMNLGAPLDMLTPGEAC